MRGFAFAMGLVLARAGGDTGTGTGMGPVPEAEAEAEWESKATGFDAGVSARMLCSFSSCAPCVLPVPVPVPVPSHRICRMVRGTSLIFDFGVDDVEVDVEEVLTARVRRCSLAVRRMYRYGPVLGREKV